MTKTPTREQALAQLRSLLVSPSPDFKRMIDAQAVVLARFQPMFKPEALPKLSAADFQSFLLLENNHHWGGLHRMGPKICASMPRLRKTLGILLDDSKPIKARLEQTMTGGPNSIPGLGKAVVSALLLVTHPDQYGVWNGTSQAGLEALGLWPEFKRGASQAEKYLTVNQTLTDLASELGVDLWTLDGLWWQVVPRETELKVPPVSAEFADVEPSQVAAQAFGLERHLHDFLEDNWERTPLGKDWDLHVEDGEVVGSEYPTPVGRIDILAKHKREPAWLVVELKRDQSSDATMGQAMRYMGYVREHLARKNDRVEGLIIAQSGDERLRYALKVVPGIRLMVYEVDFRLKNG